MSGNKAGKQQQKDSEGLTGDELASKLKSSVVFKGKNSVKDASLKLSAADMKWWLDAKFGMFIHWGLYAIPGRGEWVMHKEKIPTEEYAKLAQEFIPRRFNADDWACIAQSAGMRYMVLTARHHDGFALWNSPSSFGKFCSARTAAKRDFVAEYLVACRKAGLGAGLYYSPMDWRFPGYFDPKSLADNAALMKRQCYGQVEELVSNYGKIDVLWYDGGWLSHKGTDADAAWFWEPLKLNAMVRKHQPKAVISPRSGWEGDFQCDEGGHEIKGPIIREPWEKCLNLNMCGWGFTTKQNVMTVGAIVKMLVNVVGRGGNVLLNVGPDRDGVIPEPHALVLKQVGDWLRVNGEGIYGTRPGPFEPVDGIYCSTFSGNEVYIHILDPVRSGNLLLPVIKQRVVSSTLLSGGTITCSQDSNGTLLSFTPSSQPDGAPVVARLVLEKALSPL